MPDERARVARERVALAKWRSAILPSGPLAVGRRTDSSRGRPIVSTDHVFFEL